MTNKDYADYQKRVARFFESEGIENLSTVYDEDSEPIYNEFSSVPCECCQRPKQAGQRYHVNAYNPTTKAIQEYDVCPDCLYYANYGHLDDQTMLDMQEDFTQFEEI